MAKENNYILGAGEQLVETILPPPRKPRKDFPYTQQEAKQRLEPLVHQANVQLRQIPANAAPDGQVVASITLHPQFLSKSAFPTDLLKDSHLTPIGSKSDRIKPDKVARKSEPKEEPTATLFVAGTVENFEHLATILGNPLSQISQNILDELTAIEDFKALLPSDRLSVPEDQRTVSSLECVLHTPNKERDEKIIEAFRIYAESLGVKVEVGKELFAAGLCFVSVSGKWEAIQQLAYFSYLRRVRPMPRIRPLLPTGTLRGGSTLSVSIPQVNIPLEMTVGVFDAGLPDKHAMTQWVSAFDYGVPPYSAENYRLHGLQVSSAASFGPLENLTAGMPPYKIDHHGVLGEDPTGQGYHEALKIVQSQVRDKDYPLFNISWGPEGAINDNDVDSFTAVMDELLSDGKRLAFIAVGNDGDLPDDLQLNRVQPPSDAVNAIGIGASGSRQANWQRADYSCVGPGRYGCRVKPDFIFFGGSPDEPFGCIGPGLNPTRRNVLGTSFASPASMRVAGEVLGTLGNQITPTTLRALLTHEAKLEGRDKRHVGHGLLTSDLATILTSEDFEAKVLFQGELIPGKYVKHDLPIPEDLNGMVELDATLCFASPVDSNFPATYVQAGIETIFRPHSEKFRITTDEDGKEHQSASPISESLLSHGRTYGANDEKKDAHLWETVLRSGIKRKRGSSYKNPSIELHYNRRSAGQPTTGKDQPKIPYSLILTIRCKAEANLYDQIRTRYGANLQALRPKAQVTLKT